MFEQTQAEDYKKSINPAHLDRTWKVDLGKPFEKRLNLPSGRVDFLPLKWSRAKSPLDPLNGLGIIESGVDYTVESIIMQLAS